MDISGIYRHFKGKEYKVFSQASDMDTGEIYVLYQQLYAPYQYWIRPWDKFFSEIDINGVVIPRFSKVKALDDSDTFLTDKNIQIINSETLEIYSLNIINNVFFVKCANPISNL